MPLVGGIQGQTLDLTGWTNAFAAAALLLDLDQPERVIGFFAQPVMVAEKDFERSGFLPDIVFPTGLVGRKDHLLVYYGAADTATGVAQYDLNDLLGAVTPC